jgi:hypothetical protein
VRHPILVRDGDPRQAVMLAAPDAHLDASLAHVTGDYVGEHWIANYAALALGRG